MPLIIAITDDGVIIYTDSAHAIHMDSKKNIWVCLPYKEKGAMINILDNLGIVTIRSTDTKVSTGEQNTKMNVLPIFLAISGRQDQGEHFNAG